MGTNHFITKPENPAELEERLRSLLKNLEELSSIRRGVGKLDATAVSALNASSDTVRKFYIWVGVILAFGFLVGFAFYTGVL